MAVSVSSSCCAKFIEWVDDHKEPLTVMGLAVSVSCAVMSAVFFEQNYPAQACSQAACLLAGQAALIGSHLVPGFHRNIKSVCLLAGQAAFGAAYGCATAAVSSSIFRGWIATGGFILGATVPNVGCASSRDRGDEDDSMTRPMVSLD